MSYQALIDRKHWRAGESGREAGVLPSMLFPFQDAMVRWASRKGRAALFADCGLGKTFMQLAWAQSLGERTLIVAPLCVAEQTIREAAKLGMEIPSETIQIVNYERLHQIQSDRYRAVVLDESSILKSVDGKTKRRILDMFRDVPFKLACTATPAPNDISEYGNHCEFLGVMTAAEMLGSFFVHDEDGWRLKGHARDVFWEWMTSWALFARTPSDLGFSDLGFLLPELVIKDCTVPFDGHTEALFPEMGLGGIRGRIQARRTSGPRRIAAVLDLVGASADPWIVWCGLNDEQDAIAKGLWEACVSVQGADSAEDKTRKILMFLDGTFRVLVTKPRVAGFGLNFQHCHHMAFLGLSDSYEQYYQCIRRCWRFGQPHPVEVHVVVSEAERAIVENVREKERVAALTAEEVIRSVGALERALLKNRRLSGGHHMAETTTGERWRLVCGDAYAALAKEPDASVDLSVFSPPFLSLFTYSGAAEDLGNARSDTEFYEQFRYIVQELMRVTKPGRLACVHVAQVVTTKQNQGVIGLKDFRGSVIALFQTVGWTYHGDVTIDKDPQAQAIRTHSKALLFVQLRKDASWLRPALADYLLLFRAPGENAVPIHPDLSNEDWIEWARPVWYGLRESDTLNVAEARTDRDERHICPLQLGTIERCIRLWSNPGDIVLSPFAGIGSEGYEAVRLGRRFLGVELKPEYASVAVRNLQQVERMIVRQEVLKW